MPSGEFTKSVGKQLCWSPVFNKITGRLNKRLRQCSSRQLCSFSLLYVHSRNNWNFSRKVQKVCFPNKQENTYAQLFTGTVDTQADCSTGVFPWILWDFLEHLFFITWLSYVIQNKRSNKSSKIYGKFYVNGCFWYYWE